MPPLHLLLVPPLAVHISANVLSPTCTAFGFVAMFALLVVGAFRLREDEVARIGVVTAALFIASSIHIPLPPGTVSVHLLLSGLAGVVLGVRVCLAIPVGLLLQAVLLGHGDVSTLGVNSCVMIGPALLARPMYRAITESRRLGFSEACLAMSCLLWPWLMLIVGPLVFAARRLHLKLPRTFQAGFVIGFVTVFVTALAQSVTLAVGGAADLTEVAVLSLIVHAPLALIEGAILGTTVKLIAKVKPALLSAEAARIERIIPADAPRPAALPTAPAPR